MDVLIRFCGIEITTIDYFHAKACQPPTSLEMVDVGGGVGGGGGGGGGGGILADRGKIAHKSP